MVYLRVELHAVKTPVFISDCHIGTGGGMPYQLEAFRYLRHVIPMAHPANALLRKLLKQRAACIIKGFCFAVFSGGILLRRRYLTAQMVRHELTAVANAQHWHA